MTLDRERSLQAMESGERVEVSLREQPDLYMVTAQGPTGTD